jgi:hypothetical protein
MCGVRGREGAGSGERDRAVGMGGGKRIRGQLNMWGNLLQLSM